MLGASLGLAENIDPYDEGSQYAYGENIGWINFDPQVPTDPEHYGVRTSWQAGECFYVGKVDACGHVVTQADHNRWITLGRPDCWCDPCHCRVTQKATVLSTRWTSPLCVPPGPV